MKWWLTLRTIKTGTKTPDWVFKYKKYVYGVTFFALFLIIIQSGLRWQLPKVLAAASTILDYVVFAAYLFDALLNFYYTFPKKHYLQRNWLDLLVFVPFVLNIVTPRAGVGIIVIRNIAVIVKAFTRTRKFSSLVRGVRFNTTQVIALSFLGAILGGTLLLTFPAATTDGRGATFIDALFTATSATCVTGLIVQDTPTYFSGFGQMVILVLIQLGGLGIMSYSAFLALLFGRFTLGQKGMLQDMMDEDRNVLSMIIYVFKMTFVIEFAGAVVLFLRWVFVFKDPLQSIYISVFHSVSAFCNAGFSLFSDSLEGYIGDPLVNFIIMGLIICGGIGFIVVYEITQRINKPRRFLSTHSRLVLTTSALLVIAGFIAFFFFEFDGAFLNYPVTAKIWGALFQSVTPRTAGFNTIPIASLSAISLTIMMILMFIGASPGSTGGGIKTTTFAILLLSLKNILQGKADIEVFKRTIPSTVVYKALAIVVGTLLLLTSVFLLLLAFENKPFLPLLFEAVSAFGTVGLSMGITPDLTIIGKLLIIILMYGGRLGPLTLGFALTRVLRREKIEYPAAKVMIG
ncbi:MAG: TrkH family potassium uptake protein [candidate division WOR-3 bacterium]|nr:TrkH family potassium uptake protein [candidate division WOR-3 bacterium]